MVKYSAQANWEDKETKEAQTRTVECEYDFGETLHDLIGEVGEEAVFHHAKSSMIVSLQGAMRSWAISGLTDDEILVKLDEWSVPTGKPRGVSRLDKLKDALSKMSPEERAAIMADLD